MIGLQKRDLTIWLYSSLQFLFTRHERVGEDGNANFDIMLYLFGDNCELDGNRYEFRRNGCDTNIEPKVFDLLLYLIENRDRLISREELNKHIWRGQFVSDSSLSTCVKLARQAIGDDGKKQDYIRTVARRGFRFVGNVQVCDPVAISEPSSMQTDLSGIAKPSLSAMLPVSMQGPEIDLAAPYLESSPPKPFVGRRREIRQFQSVLENCLELQRGQVVMIKGPAGIGKSRLMERFQQVAEAYGFVTCSAESLGAGDETTSIRSLARHLLDRRHLNETPILLTLDDVPSPSAVNLDDLMLLADRLKSGAAVLLVCSRTDDDWLTSTWRQAAAGAPYEVIGLKPLRDSEAHELAEDFVCTARQMVTSIAGTCVAEAGGNPRALEHLLRGAEGKIAVAGPGSIFDLDDARVIKIRESASDFNRSSSDAARFNFDRIGEISSSVLGIVLLVMPLALWVAWSTTVLLVLLGICCLAMGTIMGIARFGTDSDERNAATMSASTERVLGPELIAEFQNLSPYPCLPRSNGQRIRKRIEEFWSTTQ